MSKLGKIGFLIAGLSFIIWLVARLLLGGWMDFYYILFGISGLAILMSLIVDHKFYIEFFAMKTTKHGMNMGVIILLAIVLMVAVNFLGTEFDKSFDMTKEKLNSLSDQSIEALKNLKSDLKIMIFFRSDEQKESRAQLKQNFQTYVDASPKIKVSVIDALLDQETAKKYLEHEHLAVIVEYDGKRVKVDEPYDEEKTTTAILKAMAKEQKTVTFITGHGERDIDGAEQENIKQFAEGLRNEGYTVAKVNLTKGDKLPDPPGVVIIAGPKSPYLDAEIDRLRTFARAGGHLMICIDPGEEHNLANLTKTLGIEFKNNFIINQFEELNELGPLAAIGGEYDRNSEITKKFYVGGRTVGSIFLIASEITKASDAPSTLTFKDLVKSAPRAYTNTKPRPADKPDYHQVTIAMSVAGALNAADKDDALKKNFEAVVFGDSDFMSNTFFRLLANRDLAMNSVAWLEDDANHISIRPKTPEATPLEMTSTKEVIFMLSGIGLPLLLVIAAGFTWYRRRNL